MAVFDYAGRLAYANPAFRNSSHFSSLVEGRGYLASRAVENARRDAIHRGAAVSLGDSTTGRLLEYQVLPLQAASGWTAILVREGMPVDHSQPGGVTLSVLAHEIRGPLLVAQESLEMLTQLTSESSMELRDAVARQGRSLARLSGIVQGLTDLSRARELDLDRSGWTEVNLCQQVAEVGETYQALAFARGFELIVTRQSEALVIDGHAELLARAIANLVDNALKYGTAPGPIRLAIRERGSLLVVEVADAGPGIAPSDQPAVFTEFHRLSAARNAHTPGTGLGLTVARRVAEAHGGRLSLESHLGEGSIFKLSFLSGRRGRLDWRLEPATTAP